LSPAFLLWWPMKNWSHAVKTDTVLSLAELKGW
jgi:hypothetical protein